MAVTVSQRLKFQKSTGICIFYSSSRRYWILVDPSRFCSSFSIVTGLPDAFARAQAMALESGHPTASCVLGSFFVSSHRSLKIWFVTSMVTVLSSTWMLRFFVISNSSKSLGSLFCKWGRSVSVNDVPSFFSSSLERARPGGVNSMPPAFSECSFFWSVSSGSGRGLSDFRGMKTRLDW